MDLLKELLTLKEAAHNEGDFVVALMDKNDKFKGYYVADDENPTKSIKNALKYSTMKKAKNDAKINNDQWDLKIGDYFVAQPTEAKAVTESFSNRQLWSSEEFETEFNALEKLLNKAHSKLESHDWVSYMQVTDENFTHPKNSNADDDTDGDHEAASYETQSEAVSAKVKAAVEALEELYNHLTEAA
jgi:hypothetical protein